MGVTIDTWVLWDHQGKIAQYDATFRWFSWLLDVLFERAGSELFHCTDPEEVQRLLGGVISETICETHEEFCLDQDQQYKDYEECVGFLTEEVRFGKAYELGRDTLLCREVHEHMVRYRPGEHCPHIGPSGGGYCVDDMEYEEVVREKYFREGFIPFGFGGENPWVSQSLFV